MEKELFNGRMVKNMLDSLLIIEEKVTANLFGETEGLIMECGEQVNSTEKVYIFHTTEK